ncbi:NRPS, partial [Arthroderma sp. PD_2]
MGVPELQSSPQGDDDLTPRKNGAIDYHAALLKQKMPSPEKSSSTALEYLNRAITSEPGPWPILDLLRCFEKTNRVLTKRIEEGTMSSYRDMIADTARKVKDQFRGLSMLIQADCKSPAIIDPRNNAVLSHGGLFRFIEDFQLPCTLALDVKPVVAIALSNGPLLAVACLAVSTYYTAAPMSSSTGEEQFRTDLNLAGARVILAQETDIQRLGLTQAWVQDAGIEVLVVHSSDNLTFTLSPLSPRPCTSQKRSIANLLDDCCLLLFTSGTSGRRKAVPISMYSLLCGTAALAENWELGPSDVCLNMMPYNHIAGLIRNLFTPILSGGATICCPAFDVRMFWDLVDTGIPTWYYASPALHTEIIRGVGGGSTLQRTKKIRLVGSGASQLLLTLASQLRATFHCPVSSSYGMTECIPIATAPCSDGAYAPDSLELNRMLDVSIRDDENREVAAEVVGNVCVRGAALFSGYLGPEGLDKSVFSQEGWFNTGDLGLLHQDGCLVLAGRSKEVINRGGETISPYEIEDAILRASSTLESSLHNKVSEALAFSVPHSVLDEVIGVVLVATSKSDRPDLRHLRDALEHSLHYTKWPTIIVYMDKLPMFNRKLRRRNLATLLGIGPIPDETDFTRRHFKASESDTGILALEQVDVQPLMQSTGRVPETDMERKLQQLWAQVLHVEPDAIGADSSFLQMGGDSIRAIRLTAALQDEEEALTLAVADVFASPRLSDMAQLVKLGPLANDVIEPFSLLGAEIEERQLKIHAALQCGIDEQQVVDVFPCTPLQEGLLAMSSKRPGKYVRKIVFELEKGIDMARFQTAWRNTVTTTPVLRTRIVDLPRKGLVQVIVDEDIQWSKSTSLVEEEQSTGIMGLGTRLVQYALVEEELASDRCLFVWTLHHAIYDAWSANLVLDQVRIGYAGGKPLTLTPFQNFIKYVKSQGDDAVQYWQSQLAHAGAASFPKLPAPGHQPQADSLRQHHVQNFRWPRSDITPSTAVRTAWALLMARYTGSTDVVFGSVVTGRQSPIHGVERTPGPTIATVPIRISFEEEDNLHLTLQRVQRQAIEMSKFEQMGLQNIRRISPTISQTSQFQTLLVLQPRMSEIENQKDVMFAANSADEDASFLHSFNIYLLMLECYLEEDGLQLDVSFDSSVLDGDAVDNIMQQFEHVLRDTCSEGRDQLRLKDLQRPSEQDLQRIWQWNSTVPPTVDACVHDLITERARSQPNAPAVHSWDGDLTYRDLDHLSTNLSYHLIQLGLKQGIIVPLCFEKSMWMPVAMLA